MTPDQVQRAVGYARVSTDEQGDTGASLDAQEHAIRHYAQARGWTVDVVREVASGKSRRRRPVLASALHALRGRQYDALIVTKLDRLSRYAPDAILIADSAPREGWALAVLDMGGVELDTTTAAGRAHLGMMAVFAQMFRDQISENTRSALAQRKREGVRLGRPGALEQDARPEERERMTKAVARIRELRDGAGLSWRKIAATLDQEGLRGAQGGRITDMAAADAYKRYGKVK